jgi:hypothetical protein
MFPDYEKATVLFVYSKKHDDTPRWENKFRYEIAEKLPTFRGKVYTSGIIIGEQFNPMTADYFEMFDDSVVVGIGKYTECVAGK